MNSNFPLKIQNSRPDPKILSRNKLSKILHNLKKRGKKIVFTNGCFDILHTGHIRLFKKAKSYGDFLVVAINSDSSVKKLKGHKRPIISQRERAEILSAIEYIDFITIYDDDTPLETLKILKPDVLVKGADYKFNKIVGYGMVSKTIRFKMIKNRSTSNLIQKISKL